MILIVIIFSAICAIIADHYNTWYIAREQAQATVEDTPVLESVPESKPLYGWDAINAEIQEQLRLSRENEEMQRAREEERQRELYKRKAERLHFSIDAADEEIEVAMTRREKLIALYDCKAQELEGVIPNGKEWQKIQKSLLTYENQLNTVEKRISKAQFTRKQALAELKEIA